MLHLTICVSFAYDYQEKRALEENQLLRKQVKIYFKSLTLAQSSLQHISTEFKANVHSDRHVGERFIRAKTVE